MKHPKARNETNFVWKIGAKKRREEKGYFSTDENDDIYVALPKSWHQAMREGLEKLDKRIKELESK